MEYSKNECARMLIRNYAICGVNDEEFQWEMHTDCLRDYSLENGRTGSGIASLTGHRQSVLVKVEEGAHSKCTAVEVYGEHTQLGQSGHVPYPAQGNATDGRYRAIPVYRVWSESMMRHSQLTGDNRTTSR